MYEDGVDGGTEGIRGSCDLGARGFALFAVALVDEHRPVGISEGELEVDNDFCVASEYALEIV